jgi:hypothetical protein
MKADMVKMMIGDTQINAIIQSFSVPVRGDAECTLRVSKEDKGRFFELMFATEKTSTQKINVLGVMYEIIEDDGLINDGNDGVCDVYNEVMRHELVHAFFYESGLCEYSDNEQLVDWIATQYDKLHKAFGEAEHGYGK